MFLDFQEDIERIQSFGHNITLIDPYFGKKYTGARVQAIAVDRNSSILTANNDKRKSGGVSGY